MSTDFDEISGTRKPRASLVSLLLIPILAFVGGIAAMAWLLTQWSAAASLLGVKAPPAPPPPAVRAVAPPLPVPATGAIGTPERIVIDPEISRRVALLEQRIGAIDTQAREAVSNADRAEGLLVAFAARRAFDRGLGLGYIEGLLRQRFGQTQPQAVATIITASKRPVTLQELQEGLRQVSPTMLGAGPQQSWWAVLRGEFSSLVTIRKAGTPSAAPAERLRRATQRLEAGDVEVALAEVIRLPGSQNAAEWMDKATRYLRVRRALDMIEAAALLEPRVVDAPLPAPAAAPAGNTADF